MRHACDGSQPLRDEVSLREAVAYCPVERWVVFFCIVMMTLYCSQVNRVDHSQRKMSEEDVRRSLYENAIPCRTGTVIGNFDPVVSQNPVFRAVHFERLCRRLPGLGCTTPSARQSRLTDDRIEMYSEIPVVGEPPRFSDRPGISV